MRARLAVRVSGVRVALREVALRNKPAEMLAASPKATVPVLQLAGGTVIDQSIDIMRWALSRHDPQGWLRAEETDEAQALIDLNDGAFKQALDHYKYAPRYPERSAADYREEAVELMLAPLNQRLTQHRYLLRDTPSLADMAILPFVRQFAMVDEAWFAAAPLQWLDAWLKDIVASPLFQSVMPKLPPWQPDADELVF